MNEGLRRRLIEGAVAMNESGLNQGTAGNVSIRCEGGMLVTPSGMAYTELAPEDVVWIDQDGRAHGRRKPSSEWRFHLDIYRQREDIKSVVHCHPPHATAASADLPGHGRPPTKAAVPRRTTTPSARVPVRFADAAPES